MMQAGIRTSESPLYLGALADKPDVPEQLVPVASLTRPPENSRSGPKLQRLDKVLHMSKTSAMSSTSRFPNV
jgi:hypothetical protein